MDNISLFRYVHNVFYIFYEGIAQTAALPFENTYISSKTVMINVEYKCGIQIAIHFGTQYVLHLANAVITPLIPFSCP